MKLAMQLVMQPMMAGYTRCTPPHGACTYVPAVGVPLSISAIGVPAWQNWRGYHSHKSTQSHPEQWYTHLQISSLAAGKKTWQTIKPLSLSEQHSTWTVFELDMRALPLATTIDTAQTNSSKQLQTAGRSTNLGCFNLEGLGQPRRQLTKTFKVKMSWVHTTSHEAICTLNWLADKTWLRTQPPCPGKLSERSLKTRTRMPTLFMLMPSWTCNEDFCINNVHPIFFDSITAADIRNWHTLTSRNA